MKRYISFSGGVESTTMCLLFGNKADAIFADTGFEHELLYERIDKVEKAVRAFHGNNFKVIRIKSEKHGSLKDYIVKQKFYPSPLMRFCTAKFKIEPIDAFLKTQSDCELMIGLNADEQQRVGNHGLLTNVTYSYPLIELNINRAKCEQILNAVGLHPHFPAYMQRGGCVGCFFKSKKEYVAMALLNEDEFDQVMQIEESIQDKRDSFYSILGNITLRELKTQAKASLFPALEMYPEKQFFTNCGVFCHR